MSTSAASTPAMRIRAQGVLPDGTRVAAVRVPGARALGVTLVLDGGSASERPDEAGIAHLTEHLLHHGARDPDGRGVDERVLAVGGVSNAQTYPFHTEYSFLVPATTPAAHAAWIEMALRRRAPLDVSWSAIERERALVRREVAERVARSPLAGFPWSAALSTLTGGHDALTDLSGLDAASPRAVRAFHDARRASGRSALGIAADIDPRALLALAGATAVDAAQPAGAEIRLPLRRTAIAARPVVVSGRPGLTAPVRADVRHVEMPGDASVARGLLLVATRVATATSGSAWRSGLLGALLGPDHEIVTSVQAQGGMPAGLRTPSSRPLRRERADTVEIARQRVLSEIDEHGAGTATAGALAARDALAGLDPAITRAAVLDVDADTVVDLLETIDTIPAGTLIWQPRRDEPQDERSAAA